MDKKVCYVQDVALDGISVSPHYYHFEVDFILSVPLLTAENRHHRHFNWRNRGLANSQ